MNYTKTVHNQLNMIAIIIVMFFFLFILSLFKEDTLNNIDTNQTKKETRNINDKNQ